METMLPDESVEVDQQGDLAAATHEPPRKMVPIRPGARPPGRPRKNPPSPPAPSDVALDAELAPEPASAVDAPADVIPDRSKGKAKLPATPALTEIRRREDQAISDWLSTLRSSGGSFRYALARSKPASWQGRNLRGHIETTTDAPSEEEIAAQYGGGTYEIRVHKRNEQGSYVFFTSTAFDITGDPKLPPLELGAVHSARTEDPLMKTAVGFMERTIERQERELGASRDRPAAGTNLRDLEVLLRPLEAQVAALSAANAQKDQQILTLISEGKKEDPFQQKMLANLLDGDTARVNAVRDQLMSELRMVKEHAREDEKRLRDQFDRDLKQAELRHQREVDNLRASHEREMIALKMAADTSKEVLNSEVRRYTADNGDLRTEVKILREKKDQSLLDKAKEVEALKEILGTGDDAAEKSTIEKIADTAFSSEKLFEFAGRWFAPKPAGAQQQGAPQQATQQQPRMVRQRSTGKVFALQPNGEYAEVPQRRRGRGQPPAQAAGATAVDSEETETVQVDPQDVATATAFLEAAFKNGIDMNALVTSARSMIPEGIMAALAELGVEGFMAKVAKIPSTSPLASQAGRNWIKKFGKALLGDSP